MKTFLKEFSYEKLGEIRTCQVNHQIMFVGKDVAQALGYKNTRKAIQNHVDDEDREDGVTIRESIGRYQQAILINESRASTLLSSHQTAAGRRAPMIPGATASWPRMRWV